MTIGSPPVQLYRSNTRSTPNLSAGKVREARVKKTPIEKSRAIKMSGRVYRVDGRNDPPVFFMFDPYPGHSDFTDRGNCGMEKSSVERFKKEGMVENHPRF